MRRTAWMLAWFGLAAGAAFGFAGCGTAYDEFYAPLAKPNGPVGVNPACAGEPSGKNITDECGVFVRAATTGAAEDGTREKPFTSLQRAIDEAKAKSKRVY